MDDIGDQHNDHMHQSELVDVSSLPIDELIRSVNPVLAESIRNLIYHLGSAEDTVASWQSFVE